MQNLNFKLIMIVINKGTFYMQIVKENYVRKQHIFEETCLTKLKLLEVSLSWCNDTLFPQAICISIFDMYRDTFYRKLTIP